jgi:hypothetical protein
MDIKVAKEQQKWFAHAITGQTCAKTSLDGFDRVPHAPDAKPPDP